jgi:hypothetical protein
MCANPYRQTVSQKIIGLLRRREWVSGMEIESNAYDWRSKRIGRTLREMSSGESPILEKRYGQHNAVQYKLKEKI